MTAPATLFDEAAVGSFHVGDPWTSKAAARRVALIAGTTRYRVLEALAAAPDFGLTDYELAGRLQILATTAGTRRGELEAAGYVEALPIRRPTDTGALAKAHKATEAGIAAIGNRETAPSGPSAPLSAAKPPGRAAGRTRSRYGLTSTRDRVLEELVIRGPAGYTDDELAAAIGELRTAVGTARKQLVDAGLAVALDDVRRTPTGNRAVVHRAIEPTALEELRRVTDLDLRRITTNPLPRE